MTSFSAERVLRNTLDDYQQQLKISNMENKLLRRIVYECCGLSDFQRLGIDQRLYEDIVAEFECENNQEAK